MVYQLDPNADWTALPAAVRKGNGESDPDDVRPRDWQTISLALRDAQGAVVGGLYGVTMRSWLMVDGLWVAPEQRGQGLGRRLLLASEETAIQRGCLGSWLGTFDFQAKAFYERHGYSVFAALAGIPPGHTHFHLRKHFSVPSSAEPAPEPDAEAAWEIEIARRIARADSEETATVPAAKVFARLRRIAPGPTLQP